MTELHKNIKRLPSSEREDFGAHVRRGLAQMPKRISSRFFYDEEGSRLFEEIMKLPEYYPTRCEREIFEESKGEILYAMGEEPFRLIDLGAGDGLKTMILLEHFQKQKADFSYHPIDIDDHILEKLLADLHNRLPDLKTATIAAEYFEALRWLGRQQGPRKLVLFMGANIGNFTKDEALSFLQKMKADLHPGDRLLIGFDLKKDPDVILHAYRDAEGVTSQFNYNLLRRMNRELGADFDLGKWKHYATYHPVTGATESFLLSKWPQEVHFKKLDLKVLFGFYEPIHTEYSLKYNIEDVEAFAYGAGFNVLRHFFSRNAYFVDSLWEVV